MHDNYFRRLIGRAGTEDFFEPALAASTCGASSAPARMVKNATLKVHPGAPHGLMVTNAEPFNADLLAFIKA